MSDPLISVLMPVYNAERYLAEAVESILAQTLRDFEFLIIDDGSTDRSLAILEGYAARDRRIRLISRPNTGYTVTLNEGLAQARSDLIARMDADDVSASTRFEAQVAYLDAHPECVAVGTGIMLIDPEGCPICRWTESRSHEEIDAANMRGLSGQITHPSTIFRREALQAIGGYRPEFEPAEDLDVYLRLAERGRLANVPEILFQYRQHLKSVGHQHPMIQQEKIREAVRMAYLRRGLPFSFEPEGPRAPTRRVDHHQKWVWWALGDGNVQTARKHALRTIRLRPFSVRSWQVAACALRGH